MAYKIDENVCISCGSCAGECPTEAISAGDNSYVIDGGVNRIFPEYERGVWQRPCPFSFPLPERPPRFPPGRPLFFVTSHAKRENTMNFETIRGKALDRVPLTFDEALWL